MLINYIGDMLTDSFVRFIVILGVILLISSTVYYYIYINVGIKKFINLLTDVRNNNNGMNLENVLFQVNENVRNNKSFPKSIKKSWNRYYEEYNANKGEVVPDPFEYFTEEQLVNKGGHRKVLELIPPIFVSLGILGTFYGITAGISDINTQADLETMQDGINTLLEGMKTAFYTSIVGISISLIFQLFDRIVLHRKLINEYDLLLDELDKTIPFKTEDIFLNAIEKNQQEQLQDLKSFFADEFVTKLTSGLTDTMAQSINPHLEKSNEIMEKVAQNTIDAQGEKLNEMVNYFVQSLSEISGDHMRDLGIALQKTVEWQEKVTENMGALVNELTNVAVQQAEMAKNTTELSEKMNSYTITLTEYQEKLNNSTEELNSITVQNTSLLDQMRTLMTEINERNREEQDILIEKNKHLNTTLENISDAGIVLNNQFEELKSTIGTLTNITNIMDQNAENNMNLNDALLKQHEKSNQWSEKTQSLLEQTVQNMELNEAMQEKMEFLFTRIHEERDKLDNMKQEQIDLLNNSMAELKTYWDNNSEALFNNSNQLGELNNMLNQSMNDFADHMHRGVQGTFEQFDKELKRAVQYLERGVNGIQQVVESMEQDIDNVDGQISRFHKVLEKVTTTVEMGS